MQVGDRVRVRAERAFEYPSAEGEYIVESIESDRIRVEGGIRYWFWKDHMEVIPKFSAGDIIVAVESVHGQITEGKTYTVIGWANGDYVRILDDNHREGNWMPLRFELVDDMFKVGDLVELNLHRSGYVHIHTGEHYIVTKLNDDGTFGVNGMDWPYPMANFKRVKNKFWLDIDDRSKPPIRTLLQMDLGDDLLYFKTEGVVGIQWIKRPTVYHMEE